MNSNTVLVAVVQIILFCAPLNRQAAALDLDQDPDQLWNIGWELSQDSLNHQDLLRVKHPRHDLSRDRRLVITRLHKSDMLQELLTPWNTSQESLRLAGEQKTLQGIRYNGKEQETRILEELLVETPLPRQ